MKTILLIFRKRRPSANFSIEASFEEMSSAFDGRGELNLRSFVSSHTSTGIRLRLAALVEVARERADVFHVTGDVHFLTLALPANRCILTIHDVGFLGRGRTALSRWFLRKLWLDWPVNHCKVVTTVSQATRADVLRITGCAPEKVTVIPTVIRSSFAFSPKTFDVDCPTVLHIGLAPNKNFFRHVEAIAGLRCKLIVIGRLSDEHRTHLAKHAVEYESLENLTDHEMRCAYERSDIVLFASTLEGFGMPIIEANTVGRVVITSKTSSMPEVAGNAACLVDPLDVGSIRAGLKRVIEDENYRKSLIEAGRSNCQRFSSRAVAEQYRAVYQRITDSSIS